MSEYEDINFAVRKLDNKKTKNEAKMKLALADVLLHTKYIDSKKTVNKYNKWQRDLVEVANKEFKEHETVFDRLKQNRKETFTVFDRINMINQIENNKGR